MKLGNRDVKIAMIKILKYLVEKVDKIHVQTKNLERWKLQKNRTNREVRNEKHDIIKMFFNGLISRLDTTKEIINKSKQTLPIFLMPKSILFPLQISVIFYI